MKNISSANSTLDTTNGNELEGFIKMTLEKLEAWKNIKDEKSCKDFDLKLIQKSLENNQICSDFISIKDFENSIDDNHFFYDCRWGYEMDINVHYFENKPESLKAYFECPIYQNGNFEEQQKMDDIPKYSYTNGGDSYKIGSWANEIESNKSFFSEVKMIVNQLNESGKAAENAHYDINR
ncbi:MAG: hypothetical protein MHPSP_000947 [Paramarteilia canceri]